MIYTVEKIKDYSTYKAYSLEDVFTNFDEAIKSVEPNISEKESEKLYDYIAKDGYVNFVTDRDPENDVLITEWEWKVDD